MSDTPKTPVADLSEDQIEHHVTHPDTSGDTLHEIAVAHPTGDNFEDIVKHPNVHPHTLEHMHSETVNEHFKNEILEHPKAPTTLVTPRAQAIDAKKDYSSYRDKDEILHHPNVDPRVRHQKVKEIIDNEEEHEIPHSKHVGPGNLSYSQRETLKRHLSHENISAEEVNELAQHAHPEVRKMATRSEKCDIQHRLNHINESKHRDLAHFVRQAENLHPDLIRAVHTRSKSRPNDEEDYLGDLSEATETHTAIAKHKNTPADLLAELESIYRKPDEDGTLGAEYNHTRQHALENKNFPLEKVKELALNDKDEMAHAALLARKDTDPETLRLLHSKYKDADVNKWGHESKSAKALLTHPNTPVDILKTAIGKDTASARAVMEREDLNEDLLHALVDHKNKNVAVDALRHRSVTPAVVERAFKRKAAEVSRAAAKHLHATPEMKAQKSVSDPKAAIETLKHESDPALIKHIYENVKVGNPDSRNQFHDQIAKNTNTPSDVVDHLAEHFSSHENLGLSRDHPIDDMWTHRDIRSRLAIHPNLTRAGRKKLIDSGSINTLFNKNIEPDELDSHLESLKRQSNSGDIHPNTFSHSTGLALRHPNLKPETATRILKGDFGKLDTNNSDIKFNTAAFTPDVIKEGLKAPEEFSDHHVKFLLAASPNLDSKHIEEIAAEHLPKATHDHSSKHIVRGLLINKNASREFLNGTIRSMLKDTDNHREHDHSLANAVLHENLTADDVDSLVGEAASGKYKIPSDYRESLAKRANKLNLSEKHAATTNDPDLVSEMIRDGRYSGVNEGAIRGAFKNPDPAITEKAIKTAGNYELERLKPELKKELFDTKNEVSREVASSVFPFMTPEGQKVYMERHGASDPAVIRSMRANTLKDVQIQPHSSGDVVDAIIHHSGVTDEHLNQAIERGPNSAGKAAARALTLYGDGPRSKALVTKAIDQHMPTGSVDNHYLAGSIAQHTRDPEILNKLLDHPKSLGSAINSIVKNTSVKPSDLERLTALKGPEYKEIMGRLAGSKKSSVKLLSHIAENYPEHLDVVATSPRAASAKVLKQIIEKGDDKAHLNLIDNEKVPQGVKDELLKNVRLLLQAKPGSVSSDILAQHANDKDLNVVSLIASHANATPQTLSDVTQRALKDWKPDAQKAKSLNPEEGDKHEKAYTILQSVAERQNLLPDTQQAIVDADPQLAVELFSKNKHSAFNNARNRSPKVALEALKKHQDSPEFGDIHGAILDQQGYKDPELIDHLIKTANLNHRHNGSLGSLRLAIFLNSEDEDRKFIRPEHVEGLYSKLKVERGPGYNYQEDSEQADSDARLLTAIAGKSSNPEHLSEIADTGAAAHALFENPNLTQDIFHRLASSPSTYSRIGLDSARLLGKSKHMTPDLADKILNIIHPNSEHANSIRKERISDVSAALASRKDLSEDTTKDLFKVFGQKAALASPKMPKSALQEATKNALKNTDDDALEHIIARRPDAKLDSLLPLIDEEDERDRISAKQQIFGHLLTNPHATSEDLRRVHQEQDRPKDNYFGTSLDGLLAKHPSTPEDVIMDMLGKRHINEEEAMAHPTVGGKLWRGKEHKFPDRLVGVERGKESNAAVYRDREEKLKKVTAMIPEGQHIEWAAFKKAYPSLANDPIVNKMFTSAPKQRLTKAHAEQYTNSLPSKSFHVSYQTWNGIQRHHESAPHSKPELVVNINNGEFMDDEFKKDPKLGGLFRMVQNASNYSGHPVTPQCIGWSRVDTSHSGHWFIDEIQSDFNAHLSRLIKDVVEQGGTNKLAQYGIEPEESDELVRRMVSHIQGWEKALMNNIIETAKKHGVKKVSIQSGKSKTMVNKGEESEVTHKYKKIYDTMPQEMGFIPGAYEDLPTHDPKSDLVGEPIWTMNLDEEAEQAQLGLPLLGGAEKKDSKKIA